MQSCVSPRFHTDTMRQITVQGKVTISNDGATIMKLLEIVHPAAKSLCDVSLSQDAEVCVRFECASTIYCLDLLEALFWCYP